MNWVSWGQWADPIKRIEAQIKDLSEKYNAMRSELLRLNDDVRGQYLLMEKAFARRDATEALMARQQIENLNRTISQQRTMMATMLDLKSSLQQEINQTKHAKELKKYTKVIALSNTVGTDPVKLDAITERYEWAMDAIKDKQQTINKTHRVHEHDQSDAAILQSVAELLRQHQEPVETKAMPRQIVSLREVEAIAQEAPESELDPLKITYAPLKA